MSESVKTPEQIAREIVDRLSFSSNRMVEGRLVGEQYFAALAIAEAITAERKRLMDAKDGLYRTIGALGGIAVGRLTPNGRIARSAREAGLAAFNRAFVATQGLKP
jgi:hypothetical protein